MSIITMKHVRKSLGDHVILGDVTFSVEPGERIGLVGSNGAGKSTLLSILAGQITIDDGSLYLPVKSSIALLSQNPDLDKLLGSGDQDAVSPISEASKYLGLMHFDVQLDRPLHTLSGGEQTKLALGRLLAENPQLLLLDEPTNNLDYQGISTLIELLSAYDGTLIIVSHDRFFLDGLADRILELENGQINEYRGNYSTYRQEKKQRFQEQMHRYQADKKQQKNVAEAINQVKQWSQKAHRDSTLPDSSGLTMGVKEKKRAKAKKMDQKVKNDIKRLERMITEGEQRPQEEKSVRFSIQGQATSGKRILEARDLAKSFGTKVLWEASNFTVARGERVAIWGPNGCGKTTLLEIITGQISSYQGELWLSPGTTPFVLSQSFAGYGKVMSLDQKEDDWLTGSSNSSDWTTLEYLHHLLGNLTGHDRALLAHLGITSRHLSQKISTLSFGEQMRIKLAEPILGKRDFIILDEPTNHIDLPMREMLEDTLSEYQGTMLLVSHDLYFLRRVCNKVLLFQDRKISRLEDSFSEYFDNVTTLSHTNSQNMS